VPERTHGCSCQLLSRTCACVELHLDRLRRVHTAAPETGHMCACGGCQRRYLCLSTHCQWARGSESSIHIPNAFGSALVQGLTTPPTPPRTRLSSYQGHNGIENCKQNNPQYLQARAVHIQAKGDECNVYTNTSDY
jgi:hypothetical protein